MAVEALERNMAATQEGQQGEDARRTGAGTVRYGTPALLAPGEPRALAG